VSTSNEITIIGGGIAGLSAAITCAEAGVPTRLLEARAEPGGRGRSITGEYTVNLGPHALYSDGALWAWLGERDLTPPVARPPLGGLRFYRDGQLHAVPPVRMLARALRLRGRQAPADASLRRWLVSQTDDRTADMLSAACGVFAFTHDPGSLSAAFAWERARRVLLRFPPAARYPIGGWTALIDRMAQHALALGVRTETSHRVSALPPPPVVVATDLASARQLLGDATLRWPSGHTVCLDLGLTSRRDDPFIVVDLDHAGWIERFTASDPSLAPTRHELIQAHMPVRPQEPAEITTARLERVLDNAFTDWRQRTKWRRRLIMNGQTGALDPPGTTWRDRPAIERDDGVFLAGDATAAPGLLSEVAHNSGVDAARRAIRYARAPAPTRRDTRSGSAP
jgi:phytoene dehydrogenase-like protein